jgi:2-polyprenyl-6-methoxyphenol hydroxylase-like FAD-dependent oxidoreductase
MLRRGNFGFSTLLPAKCNADCACASSVCFLPFVTEKGGGIGGLTVANALVRKGHAVKLFERSKKLCSAVGAGFGITQGAAILHKHLGIDIRALSPNIKYMKWYSEGRPLGEIQIREMFIDEVKPFASWVIRDDLINLLGNNLPKGVVHCDHNFESFTNKKDGKYKRKSVLSNVLCRSFREISSQRQRS